MTEGMTLSQSRANCITISMCTSYISPQSERVSSKAGQILLDTKTRLQPKHKIYLLF